MSSSRSRRSMSVAQGVRLFHLCQGRRQTAKDAFLDPVDYCLEYDAKQTVLTLHFTLPFKTPVKAKALEIEVYDPEFFIDFGFAEGPGAAGQRACAMQASVEKPRDDNFPATLRLEQTFNSEANIGMGASFANRISVKCP